MIRAVSHASHYHFGNLSRAPFYQVVDAERVDHFAGSFVPFVPFFLHNLKPPIISCSELVVSCLANLGGEWLWGQSWIRRRGPSDSSWGRRANSWHSMNRTQVAVWGFQDSIPTSGLRRHIRVYRSGRRWELLNLDSICPRRPHLQMFICFWLISHWKEFVSPWPQVWCEGEQKTAYWTLSSFFLDTVFSPFFDNFVDSWIVRCLLIDSLMLTNLLVDFDCFMSVNFMLVDPLKSTQE